MKTCTDIAQHLKRCGGYLELRYDAKAGTFLVQDGTRIQRSRFLDDALENLAEERRRADAKMTAMRDRPVEQKDAAKPTVQGVTIKGAISTAVVGAGNASPQCPQCGGKGYMINGPYYAYCNCMIQAWKAITVKP